ncbi:hypothetical protein [Paraflavitalea speifideaquila]|uniref:hypothetical protein n=1 Tax=Paraflavitalea speifideaquila TaxID=3076558 RepID=UPI0028EA3B9A|nr:hypothetical protein [Paraflavitalea speifideiaquila]
MSSFTSASDHATKSQKEFNEALEASAKRRESILTGLQAEGDKTLNTLKSQFAAEKDMRAAKLENLKLQLEQAKQEDEMNQRNLSNLLKARGPRRRLSDEEKEEEAKARELKEAANSQYLNLMNQLNAAELEDVRATKEEEVKITEQSIEIEKVALTERAKAQSEIASNERKTFEERIAATRRFATLQQEIVRKDLQKQLLDPNLKNEPKRREFIERQAQAAIRQARLEGQKQVEALDREHQKRRRAAQFEIAKTAMEGEAAVADKIADNEKKGYEVRLDAAYKAYEKRRQVIEAEMKKDLAADGLIEEERVTIHARAAEAINQLTRDYTDKQTEIYRAGNEKAMEVFQSSYDRREYIIQAANYKSLTAIEQSFRQRQISTTQYEKIQRELEYDSRIRSLMNEVNRQTGLLIATKEGTKERAEVEAAHSKAVYELNKAQREKDQGEENTSWQERIAKLQGWSAASLNIISSVGELRSIHFDRELAQLDELTAANEKLKNAEIDRITKSSLSEQDKAAKIAVINAQAESQQQEIDRRRRRAEIEKARFDKAANIANIITSTALAVVTMLADKTVPGFIRIPLAISVGTLGAAQLAKAIATPLPKFAKGTDSSPEGWAVVGEEGSEMRIDPGGKVSMTPNQATITWLERGTKIVPHDELNESMYRSMMRNTAMMISGQPDDSTNKKLDAVKDAVIWLAGEMKKNQAKAKAPIVNIYDMSVWHAHIKKMCLTNGIRSTENIHVFPGRADY